MAYGWKPTRFRQVRRGKPAPCPPTGATMAPVTLWGEFCNWLDRMVRNFFYRPEYAWDYFMLVRAEGTGLDPASVDHDSCACKAFKDHLDALYKTYNRKRHNLTIQEVWALDLLLVQMLPEAALRAKAMSVRTAYCRLAGKRMYEQYRLAAPAEPDGLTVDQLRAEISDLTRGKYWYQLNAILLERGFRSLKKMLLHWAIMGFLGSCVLVGYFHWQWPEASGRADVRDAFITVVLSGYFGMLGAIISVSMRTKAFNRIAESDNDPVVRLGRMENGKTGMRLSIVAGAVFAIVLYLVFVAQLGARVLSPDLLPRFAASGQQGTFAFYKAMTPSTAADLSKLLLWAFIAGFAEKLVPDVLDRFARVKPRDDDEDARDGSAKPPRTDAR
jgi:hypothetical protein